jgi:hypothetical protein
MKSVHFEDDVLETPATIHDVEATEGSEDADFEPMGDYKFDSTEANKENIEPELSLPGFEVCDT